MRIVVVTSCTGEKAHSPDDQLTQDDFCLLSDPAAFSAREAQLDGYRTKAEELYTGQQHVRLMRGVRQAREALGADVIDLHILSAGYGLIAGDQGIVPYECTFQGMRSKDSRAWADHLGVPAAIRVLLAEPYDLAFLLLGDSYMAACALDEHVQLGGPTIAFSGSTMAQKMPALSLLRTVVLTNQEARRFRAGLVFIKGEIAARILSLLAQDPDMLQEIVDRNTDLLSLAEGVGKLASVSADLGQSLVSQPAGNQRMARANPAVDRIIRLPEIWYDKPHREKLRYFIPDWDDQVDPDFDFATETHSGGTGGWSNQVYAHQMFAEPNYDGILISKIVAEQSKKKKAKIEEVGIHRYLRVPREFPILGDCGAFGYLNEETPPYQTGEILDYYTDLDFDYGVSIDHLIISPEPKVRQFRYELTIHNADEFLREHQQRELPWTPIGAVQGWDPQSYREAARQYVAMGYDYIALGGLVRTNTKEVLRILEQVHQVVPDSVAIHLFGLARLDASYQFSQLGVRSVDSSSHLRRAWLGAKDNYWALDGQSYAAIRIPEAGSFRARRMVQEGRADEEEVRRLERNCLNAVRSFDAGRLSVNDTLDVLDEFDHLITPDRKSMRADYQRTLEDAPWKTCPCDICRSAGVEVIIFRGNNRNRRRGFHNTYVFYRLLQRALAGEDVGRTRRSSAAAEQQMALFSKEVR